MTDALTAFGVVFLAELGDKTQLVAMGLGARLPMRPVIAGVVLGYLVSSTVSAIIGGVLGAALPTTAVAIAAGIAFVVGGIVILRQGDDDEEGGGGLMITAGASTSRIVMTAAGAIALAEFGDKTMLATASLAAQSDPWQAWIGATLGIITAGLLGVVFGSRFLARLPERVLRIGAGAAFLLVGVVILVGAAF